MLGRALLLALAFGSVVEARPKRQVAAPAVVPAPSVRVQITKQGQMTDIAVNGRQMKVSSTAGKRGFERELLGDEQRSLSAAARRAVEARERVFLCGEGEVYVSATVDGKTRSSAICPSSPESLAPWRDLLAVARAVAGGE